MTASSGAIIERSRPGRAMAPTRWTKPSALPEGTR